MTTQNDLAVLSVENAMQFVGDPDLFVEISEMLLEELPEQMGLLRQHWANRDLTELYKTAHRLKGNFGVIAAERAKEAARALEFAGKEGDQAACERAVAAVEAAVAEVVPLIESHIAAAKS